MVQTIDLNNDRILLSIDGWAVGRWRFYSSSPTDDLPHLGVVGFSAAGGGRYYLDNLCFTQGDCIITTEYNPVCSNGIEFSNPSEARCFGVTNFTDAACTNCEDIITGSFDPETGHYKFRINHPDADLERGVTWINEATGEEFTTDTPDGLSLSPNDNDCSTYGVCVRYYDRACGCWRTCCKKVCVCREEEQCGDIEYSIDPDGYRFKLNSGDVTEQQWFYEEEGQMTAFGIDHPPFLRFLPDRECRTVKVCCFYLDAATGCWKWCCREIEICRDKCCHENPFERLEWLRNLVRDCEDLDCGLKVFCCTYEGQKVFNIQDDPAICTDALGRVFDCEGNELFQWGGIGGINMDRFDRLEGCELIWKCTREICDNGRDDDGDGKIDCEDEDCTDYCNGGCTQAPKSRFSWFESGVLTIRFADRSTHDPVKWEWDFGDGHASRQPNPRHRYAEAGTYEVCLVTANDCGTGEKYCDKVRVSPATGYDVVIDVGEVSGKPGDLVRLPVFLKDCRDCSAITSFETKFAFENPDILEVVSVEPVRLSGGFFEWLPEVNGVAFTADTPVNVPNDDTLFVIVLELTGPGPQQSVATLRTDFEVELTGKKNGGPPTEYQVMLADGLVIIRPNGYNIYGQIRTIQDAGINKVYVPLFQDGVFKDHFITEESGKYEFPDHLRGAHYTIRPAKDYLDRSAINVITSAKAYDYVKYRFGVLDDPGLSPYQIITLDVNCNDKVSTLDVFLINEAILGNIDEFPGCAAWAFVPAEYSFPHPLDPFPFPAEAEIDDLNENTQVDFIGVMKGDVAFEADPGLPALAPGSEGGSTALQLKVNDAEYARGDTVRLQMRAENFTDLRAYQFALQFDPETLQLIDTHAGDLQDVNEDNFGWQQSRQGIIPTLWVNPEAEGVDLSAEEQLFTLTFLAKRKLASLSDHIQLATEGLHNFAIDHTYRSMDVTLEFEYRGINTHTTARTATGFRVYQNQPNPFRRSTSIAFDLPEATEVEFTIYNQVGQLIQRHTGFYQRGRSTLEVDLGHLEGSGQVLYYRMVANGMTQSRKMIIN